MLSSMRHIAMCVLMLLLVSACSTKPANTDYDVNYNFATLKNFSILPPPSDADLLVATRINDQVVKTLILKGYQDNPRTPDFFAGVELSSNTKASDSGVSIGLGTGGWGSHGGVSVGSSVGIPLGKETTEQVIRINIFDPSKRLIWRGIDSFKVSDSVEKNVSASQDVISNILARFPPDGVIE
ncbi:DUF4136 domain-containing protein [Shewanella sp. NIFS-20-20]|uniref:DUF4136 domain-containing protein n=1 Tax=Shewanella sp. NIFS-20-20 TaxID=2853806 RepID=UPI001C486416|nr:DUF4136 domain-containing protein [Shewanella sp. NIFS-20-20]MBV7314446.1 DUF4136 domain-containing protein [Shewanella sp. NIFS-20-20]